MVARGFTSGTGGISILALKTREIGWRSVRARSYFSL
jgi:hypothetical protein